MRDAPRKDSLSISSDPERIREARRWIAGIAREVGLEDDHARAMAVVVSEACSNIHRHAYRGSVDGRIDLRLEVDPGTVRLSVRDYAPPFEPATWSPPDLGLPREGGYGIHLMRSLMDRVEYEPSSSGTRLVMERIRAGAQPGDGEPAMTDRRPQTTSSSRDPEELRASLERLCRAHEIGHDLLDLCGDPDAFLDRMVEVLDAEPNGSPDLRALLTFVARASALRARLASEGALQRKEDELREANRRAEQAAREIERYRGRHDGDDDRAARQEVLRTLALLAHKINNPLTALMGRTQLLRLAANKTPEIEKGLAVIEQAGQRISTLIRHLSHLAKDGKLEGLERILEPENGGPARG